MILFFLFAVAVSPVARAVAVYTSPPGNLIVNGSFEDRFTGWTGTLGLYNTTKTLNKPKMGETNAVSGTKAGVINSISSSSVNQCMSQTFLTTPGTTYQISFNLRLPELFEIAPGTWVPIEGDSSGAFTVIQLRWNDQTIKSMAVISRYWNFYTMQYVATTTSSMLTFYNGPRSLASPFVDDVAVVAVPEPATSGFLAMGLAALAVSRKRKN